RAIAQVLEQAGNVGVSELFTLPLKRNYPTVVAAARSFVEHATPLATAFTDHGMASTFLADLGALITAFDASTAAKSDGRAERVGGTSAMEFHADAGLKVVQALRKLMKVH